MITFMHRFNDFLEIPFCYHSIKKGNRILRYGCRAFDTFWVPDDIESCNFQNLLIFGFHETSQNLMSFRHLLFSLFHGGTKGKNLKTPKSVKCPASISENPKKILYVCEIT